MSIDITSTTNGADSESPLVPKSTEPSLKILGHDVEEDSKDWLYVMVFPMITKDNEAEFSKDCPFDPQSAAKKIFKKKVFNPAEFTDVKTQRQFHEACRKKIAEVLTSEHCGFDVECKHSVDGDELFMKIKIGNENTVRALAQKVDLPVSFKETAYTKALELRGSFINSDEPQTDEWPETAQHKGCPTLQYNAGQFTGEEYSPAYVSYNADLKDKLKDFREVDKMHVLLWRVEQLMSVQDLIDKKVLKQMFPVHKWTELDKLRATGFSKFGGLFTCDWCTFDMGLDKVRDYFGEEVAFFFHWLSFYTQSLALISIISIIAFARRIPHLGLTLTEKRYIAIGYAFLITLWSAFFVEKYTQSSNIRITKWGMAKWGRVQPPRPEFKLRWRGTWRERCQNGFHWFLVLLVIVETVVVTALICRLRLHVKQMPADETYLGMDGSTASMVGKVLITANIKIMGWTWDFVSPQLSKWENHKTLQDLKNARVLKLFIVKAVVYFYPFFYIAFIKKYFEGCGLHADGEVDHNEGCIPELNENLVIFFASHIGFVVAFIGLFVLWTKYQVSSEIKKVKGKLDGIKYSYLELQSKCPEYIDDTDDFIELVMSLGMVMMFSAALPIMAFLAFLCNVFEIKVLSWRMVYANQRPIPRGQHGIGIWSHIIQGVCTLSIICNVALAVFAMHPIEDFGRTTKLLLFVVAQNLAMLFKQLIRFCYGDQDPSLMRVEEIHEQAMDELTGDVERNIKIEPTELPKGITEMKAVS